ncbi:mannose-1-phosphate guanylyltransferase/mannose-6-phosphate isomerase [Parvularcula sp. IMCC14364]|uniref:mannose-1-phosphate guanylyltransferase/mannose-6-phosphate isomerase n=1 Tax=Parvularcula sp. IMCC14364 TaxID=3067902 RepID=UPI0027415D2C|nr:mannose-1-phosphate guanylyltransferase/mannose-6-phosphate isomerase [Parvularcula sp. IMCC14364]
MAKIFPVIMAGGSGTRLWPVSRKRQPKQFQAIVTDQTMFLQTVSRITQGRTTTALDIADPIVICATAHEQTVRTQCAENNITLLKLILEPVGRNTAPVAAIASLVIQEIDPDGIILLLPADHHIVDTDGFWQAVASGLQVAEQGHITTFGIQPTQPETGYGYIKSDKQLTEGVFSIDSFREKPDRATAQEYLQAGNYFWNAGIFLFNAAEMLTQFDQCAADILESCKKCLTVSQKQETFIFLDTDSFSACRAESIDYAIMEHTERGAIVAPVDIGWNDIGAWTAVRELLSDDDKNVVRGDVMSVNSEGCYIRTDGPLVAAVGLENIVIVATEDAILVTTPEQAQNVKNIVAQLSESDRKDLL